MPKPKSGETEKEFLKRCIPELIHEGRKVNQSAAICYSIYRKEGTEKKSPKPKKKKKTPLSPRSKRNVLMAYY